MLEVISKWLTGKNIRSDEKRAPMMYRDRFPVIFGGSSKIEQLYKDNVVVYKCISTIARSISSINFYLINEMGERNTTFDNVLQYPNPSANQCQESFLDELVTIYLIYGHVYCYKTNDNNLMTMKVVKPHEVEVIKEQGVVIKYLYTTDSGIITINRNIYTGECDMLHINSSYTDQTENPKEVIIKSAELYNNINKQMMILLNRSCRPSGILRIDPGVDIANIDCTNHIKEIRNWISGNTKGESLVTTAKFEWQELGLRPAESNFLENKESAAKEIAQAFGVPYILLSQSEATYANYKEARKHFWEDTILPLAKRLCSELTVWLFKKKQLQLTFSLHTIRALGIDNNIQTVNEQRRMYDYPTIADGDKLLQARG